MSFPTFGNFGKSVTDLFKKKFEFDPLTVKTIQKANNGLTVESGAVFIAEDTKKSIPSYLRGYNKFTLDKPAWGSGELELHTDKNQTSKIQTKFSKLYPGLSVTTALSTKDKADVFKGAQFVFSADETYTYDKLVKGQVVLKSDLSSKARVEAGVSISVHDNWTVGGGVVVEQSPLIKAEKSSDKDVNAKSITDLQELHGGVEYTQQDLVASFYTNTDKGVRFANASYFQRVNRDLVIGALWKYDLSSNKYSVKVGSDFRLDVDTGVKTSLDVDESKLQVAVEHRLANPSVLLGIASEFNVKNPVAPVANKFGAQVTFGEF